MQQADVGNMAYRGFLGKKVKYALAVIVVVPLIMIALSTITIEWYSADRTYSDINKIPKNKVGLGWAQPVAWSKVVLIPTMLTV